jgi:hypothetical protein
MFATVRIVQSAALIALMFSDKMKGCRPIFL